MSGRVRSDAPPAVSAKVRPCGLMPIVRVGAQALSAIWRFDRNTAEGLRRVSPGSGILGRSSEPTPDAVAIIGAILPARCFD
jgi:hypothetical protein